MAAESESQPHRRLTFLSAILVGFALILVGQLVRWQVLQRDKLIQIGPENGQGIAIRPRRGTIQDHNGHILALDIFEYEVSATPNVIEDPWEVASKLAPILGRSPQQIYQQISDREATYVQLARRTPWPAGEAIKSLGLSGITLDPKPKRFYPEGELAAQVISFVNEEREAYSGVEGYYDGPLKGLHGVWDGASTIDIFRFAPIRDGCDFILTIDRAIQYMVERELDGAISRCGAKGGTIIVMDPRSGDILAMASRPSCDLNQYGTKSLALFLNPAVSSQYEPGSVFKIVTIAAGLDAGAVTPQSTFQDKGVMEVRGCIIQNQDRHPHGQVTAVDVLAHSLNVEAARVSTTLGPERFYEYVRRFGFGQVTGVDLDGETPGMLRLPGDGEWSECDLATNSFGQGIAVTPLQMITAVSAVANGGLLMRPHVVEQIIDRGTVTQIQPTVLRRVIAEQTAHDLTTMLVEAVEEGMRPAMVKGYKIAGKTGTAQIPNLDSGGYLEDRYIASFVGYAPAGNPRFVVLVKIDEPKDPYGGLEVAAPVFSSVAQKLFIHLGIPPTETTSVEG